jgi:hypothetical protein
VDVENGAGEKRSAERQDDEVKHDWSPRRAFLHQKRMTLIEASGSTLTTNRRARFRTSTAAYDQKRPDQAMVRHRRV